MPKGHRAIPSNAAYLVRRKAEHEVKLSEDRGFCVCRVCEQTCFHRRRVLMDVDDAGVFVPHPHQPPPLFQSIPVEDSPGPGTSRPFIR